MLEEILLRKVCSGKGVELGLFSIIGYGIIFPGTIWKTGFDDFVLFKTLEKGYYKTSISGMAWGKWHLRRAVL